MWDNLRVALKKWGLSGFFSRKSFEVHERQGYVIAGGASVREGLVLCLEALFLFEKP